MSATALTFLCRTQVRVPAQAVESYETLALPLIACSELLCNAVAATSGELPLVMLPVGIEDARAFFENWAQFAFLESDSIHLRTFSVDDLFQGLRVRVERVVRWHVSFDDMFPSAQAHLYKLYCVCITFMCVCAVSYTHLTLPTTPYV